ncbi:myoneurin-like [Macrobrachium nipponense]|uniref:myoneurin-like n=1 Tax=Macrobrachium nipponense TaxID=159736 RepID=UPI0030C85343
MEVSQISLEVQEKSSGNGVTVEALLCRLCGAQDSTRMLHLSDTYCIGMSATSSIFHLLDSISALLKVQEECEESMPKHVCVACFNTAVDIQAFVESAVNFQKSTIYQLYPNAKLEEVHDLTFTAPSQHYFQDTNSLFHCDDVEQYNQQSLDNVSSKFPSFGEGCCSINKVNSQGYDTERSIQVKDTGYNIITELIDPGIDPSKSSAEAVIEISPSVEQVCQVSKSTTDEDKPCENVNGSKCVETLQGHEKNTNSKGTDKNSDTKISEQTDEADELELSKNGCKKCPTCGKTFSRQSQLKSHLMSHSEARPFMCTKCNMKFKYRRNLVEHSSIHDDPPSFICSVCGLTFKQRSNLLKHERTHQKVNRISLQCNVCHKRYSQSAHLKTHMKNMHGDNQGYVCDQCNAVLQSRSSLRRHVATVHASSSKFLCPHCNKGFNNSQNYQGHIRSHTGERPYCCSTCHKTFTTSKALSRHRLIHQGTKSHRCSQCGKAFLELCDLKRHVKRHLLKRIKNASKDLASKCQDGANMPVQSVAAGMNSLSLMVLPESLLFTESQQLLDNSGSSATEIILPHDKLNSVKTVSAEPVLETSLLENTQYNIQPDSGPLSKESHILRTEEEVLGASELLPSPQVPTAQEVETVPILNNTAVLQPPEVISDIAATSLHSSSVLQSENITVNETITHANSNREACAPSECRSDSEPATMVVLSSVGTTSDYLPVANPDSTVIEDTRCQQSERVLSHATW